MSAFIRTSPPSGGECVSVTLTFGELDWFIRGDLPDDTTEAIQQMTARWNPEVFGVMP